ncbi:MAG: hypothetical protein Athens101426_456 [Parcubacteria group bacterium Athens1014_26]|nr:MAG: hypothetical protein Athens101426_456 [Parcubacteria group bacterium Athens1014_26]
MSIFYRLDKNLPDGQQWNKNSLFGKARGNQLGGGLEAIFDVKVLLYLSEKIINHIADSLQLNADSYFKNKMNDYSFLTAPAYKALEGFLFQIATELNLPSSGNSNLAGSYYFDEIKIDKHIDKLIKELENKTDFTSKLSIYEKRDIKDRIKEMKGFLRNYRHTPAHFYGEIIDTSEKADINIKIIYGTINNTAKILLTHDLIKIRNDVH